MPNFTFDVKAFVTVHVKAESEADARTQVDETLPGLLEGAEWRDSVSGETIFVNSASVDGEHDLVEVDGEAA